jgi:hypothetical protein
LEGKPIGPNQKEELKGELWFGEPKCKLGSKVHFFIFCSFPLFFLPLLFKFYENGTIAMD